MHEVLVNRLGGLSLPRKSVVRLTDRPDMTLDVYRGRKTTKQQQQQHIVNFADKLCSNVQTVWLFENKRAVHTYFGHCKVLRKNSFRKERERKKALEK